jgi:hypothetical protein
MDEFQTKSLRPMEASDFWNKVFLELWWSLD